MNKKLIALAIAGATVAPAAMAQTANPVTLYGRVYVTMEYVEAKGTGGAPSRSRLEDQSSLLGVRGTEDLGGGLKAFFQLETVFRPDQNNSAFAGRNSGVGFQGGWGSFVAGRWDTPWKTATIAIDPFGDLTLGGITGTLSDGGNFDRRDQNMVQYWSPSLGGFAFRLMATASENKGASNPRDYGANVTWTRGPIYLFGAWEQHKDNNSGTAVGQPAPGGSAVAGIPGYEEEGFAIGGSFVFGPIKVGAQYQEIEKTSRKDIKGWMGNIVWTVGNHQFIYQYMQAENGGLTTAATQPDCDSNNLGWQYNFSRRTFLLTQYTKVKNNDAANCNFGANRLTTPVGTDPQGFSVGIRHVF